MTYKISYSVAFHLHCPCCGMPTCVFIETVYGENSKKTNMGKRMSMM